MLLKVDFSARISQVKDTLNKIHSLVIMQYFASMTSFSSGPCQVKGPQALLFKKSYMYVSVISAYFESKLLRSRTSKLTRIQNIHTLMNYQTVRLVFTFESGSCASSFGSSPKMETAAVSSFGPAQAY